MQVKLNKKTMAFIAIALAIILAGVGATVAYILAGTSETKNEFIPANVTCAVEESFQGGIKENVAIRNTGNVSAFIRAAVIINFVHDSGKVYSAAPQENSDYTIEWGNGWIKGSDGFWYYPQKVLAGNLTEKLINTAKEIKAPDGYKLQIQIFATAIQAEPDSVVCDVWGVTVSNDKISPN